MPKLVFAGSSTRTKLIYIDLGRHNNGKDFVTGKENEALNLLSRGLAMT